MIVLIPYINLFNLFLDNKMSIFEEYGAFEYLGAVFCTQWNHLTEQFHSVPWSYVSLQEKKKKKKKRKH